MNTSGTEPCVIIRYYGPEVNRAAPAMDVYRNKRFN